jgi:hypothetical protein
VWRDDFVLGRQKPATPLRCHRDRCGRFSTAVGIQVFFGAGNARLHDSKEHRGGESMSIINRPPEMVKREYELQEPIAHAVEKYALFIQSTPDHVVNSALKMVIWKDAGFRRWRKQQQAGTERKEPTATSEAAQA